MSDSARSLQMLGTGALEMPSSYGSEHDQSVGIASLKVKFKLEACKQTPSPSLKPKGRNPLASVFLKERSLTRNPERHAKQAVLSSADIPAQIH